MLTELMFFGVQVLFPTLGSTIELQVVKSRMQSVQTQSVIQQGSQLAPYILIVNVDFNCVQTHRCPLPSQCC